MEQIGAVVAIAKGLIGSEGFFPSLAVGLIGAVMLAMQLRGIGRDDRSGEQTVKVGEQAGNFQERLLRALERSQQREEQLTSRIDELVEEKAELLEEMAEVRDELGLVRNQLRHVAALLRQVRDGAIAPGAIELPDPVTPGAKA